MKRLLTTLFLAISGLTLASDPTLYRDEDSGLVMEIPGDMQRTWNITNFPFGLEVTLFQTDTFPMSLILAGRIPLAQCFGEGNEGTFTTLLPQILENVEAVLNDLPVVMDILPSLASEEFPASRIRLSFTDDDESISCFDMHVFLRDKEAAIIGTAVIDEEDMKPDLLDSLTYSILESVRFIES